jgi:hypothetical protein
MYRFWFPTFFWFTYDSFFGLVSIYSLIATDIMGSIAPDWFWFCLLLIVLVRAAAPSSSVSNLLSLPLRASITAVYEEMDSIRLSNEETKDEEENYHTAGLQR